MLFRIAIVLTFSLCACSNSGNHPPQPSIKDTVARTVDQTRAERPKYEGYFPIHYSLGQDTSYIRIISNSDNLQKAWMVYYDVVDRRWSTITWIGSGKNNTVIGDTIFTRKNGLVNGASADDAPLFYTAYSQDSGKTWQPHHTYRSFYRCQFNGVRRSFLTTVLVSNDYLNETERPSVAILVQNPKLGIFSSEGIESRQNFDFLCPVTRQLLPRQDHY